MDFSKFFQRLPIHAEAVVCQTPNTVRFKTKEFRSICLRKVMHPLTEAERGEVDPKKEIIGSLMLQLANRDDPSGFLRGLQKFVNDKMAGQRGHLLDNPKIPPERREELEVKYQALHSKAKEQIEGWCQKMVGSQSFREVLHPLLEQVMAVEIPATKKQNQSDGRASEIQVTGIVECALPSGYSQHSGCTISMIDGANVSSILKQKGEIDVIILNQDSVVETVVEVKAAKGNPYMTLHGDLPKLESMLEAVRGKMVTMTCEASTAEGELGKASARTTIEFPFSQDVKPVYVLGSRMPGPEVLASAKKSLLLVEVGKLLNQEGDDVWRSIAIEEIDSEYVKVQVGEAFLSSCAAKVEPFFNKLRGIDVYIVEDGQA